MPLARVGWCWWITLPNKEDKSEKVEKLRQSGTEMRESWVSSSFPLLALAARFSPARGLLWKAEVCPSRPSIMLCPRHPRSERRRSGKGEKQRRWDNQDSKKSLQNSVVRSEVVLQEDEFRKRFENCCGSGKWLNLAVLWQSTRARSCQVASCQPAPCTQLFTDLWGTHWGRREELFSSDEGKD